MAFDPDLYNGSESLGLTGADGGAGDGGTGSVATEVAELAAEVSELSAEVAEQTEAVEEAVEELEAATDAVEEVVAAVDGMESMLKGGSGTFDPKAFASLYMTANRACKRGLGGAIEGTQRIGAEDLYDASGAEGMARAGIEGFMEKVKSAGSAVVNFIRRIFNHVWAFFVGLFNKTAKLKKRAKMISADLAGADVKVKEKIKLGSWNGYFDYAKNKLFSNDFAYIDVNDQVAAYAGLLDGTDISTASFGSAYKALVGALKAKIKTKAATSDKKEGDADKFIAQLAGIRIVMKSEDSAGSDYKEAIKAARSFSLKVVKSEEFGKLKSGEATPSLSIQDLKALVSGVESSLTRFENDKVKQKFDGGKRDRLVGYISANAKEGDTDKGDKVNLVKAVAGSVASVTTTINSLNLNILEARLDGIAAHI